MDWFDWTKFAALCAAIFFGSSALGSTSWVWFKHQVLGWSGGTLAFVGATLVGFAVWSNITLEAGPLKAKFAELEEKMTVVQRKLDEAQKVYSMIATDTQTSRLRAAFDDALVSQGLKVSKEKREGIIDRMMLNLRYEDTHEPGALEFPGGSERNWDEPKTR